MAVLARVNFSSQQRADLHHFLAEQSFIAADFRYFMSLFSGLSENYVVRGLELVSIDGLVASFGVADAMVLAPLDGSTSFFVGESDLNAESITLPQSSTVFVEAYFEKVKSAPVTTAAWDAGATTETSPAGSEFTSPVDFQEYVELKLRYSTSSFSATAIPLAKLVTDNTQVVTNIDARNNFYRLATGGALPDHSNNFGWSTERGESLVEGSAAFLGDLDERNPYYSVDETGARNDKSIKSLKEWMNAVMTSIKEVKGTPYWYSSVSGFLSQLLFFDSVNGSSSSPNDELSVKCDVSTDTVYAVGYGPLSWSSHWGSLSWNLGGTFVAGTRTYDNDLFTKTGASSDVTFFLRIEREKVPDTAVDSAVFWANAAFGGEPQSICVNGVAGNFNGVAIGDYVRKVTSGNTEYIEVVGLYNGSTVDYTVGNIADDTIIGIVLSESVDETFEKYVWFRKNYSNDDIYYTEPSNLNLVTNGSLYYTISSDFLYLAKIENGLCDVRPHLGVVNTDLSQYEVVTNNTGSTLFARDVVGLTSTEGEVSLASSLSLSTSKSVMGVVQADIPDGEKGIVQVRGPAEIDSSILVTGERTYLSTTSGKVTQSPPTAAGTTVVFLGNALSNNTIYLDIDFEQVNENFYEEYLLVKSSGATGNNEINGPISSGSFVYLPNDSRASSAIQEYEVGSGTLEVFLNGKRIYNTIGYNEVGSPGTMSGVITFGYDLLPDDNVLFRIPLGGSAIIGGSGGGGGGGSLQDAYNLGRTIITTPGAPVLLSGTAGDTLLKVEGRARFDERILAEGYALPVSPSSPLDVNEYGLYVDSGDDLIFQRGNLLPAINLSSLATSDESVVKSEFTNSSGSSLVSLSPVSINSFGNLEKTNISISNNSRRCFGVLPATILNNSTGTVVMFGLIKNVSITFDFGAEIWVDKTGSLTDSIPTPGVGGVASGDYLIRVGKVMKNASSPTQKDLFVKIEIVAVL